MVGDLALATVCRIVSCGVLVLRPSLPNEDPKFGLEDVIGTSSDSFVDDEGRDLLVATCQGEVLEDEEPLPEDHGNGRV